MSIKTHAIDLGHHRYNIHIGNGILDRLHQLLRPSLQNKRLFIITDKNVSHLYKKSLTAQLTRFNIKPVWIILPAGEASKNWKNLQLICDRVLANSPDRNDILVALGGGVIGDITGFAASILLRGLRYVQIPTTLLAQVDSSIGGKTAISCEQGKNLIGSFHQPHLVVIDTSTLSHLPQRQWNAGYAEIIKHGIISDSSLFEWYQKNGHRMRHDSKKILQEGIEKSLYVKARLVEQDERESGPRMLLNFGHTFGHALEACTDFSTQLLHGEAVALGMLMACRYASWRGLCGPQIEEALCHHFKRMGILSKLPDKASAMVTPERMIHFMRKDKKNRGNTITLILPKKIGDVRVFKDNNTGDIKKFLGEYLS